MLKYYQQQIATMCKQHNTVDLTNVLLPAHKANLSTLAKYLQQGDLKLPYVTLGLTGFKVNKAKTLVTWLNNVADLNVATHAGALAQAVHAGVQPHKQVVSWVQYGTRHFGILGSGEVADTSYVSWVFSSQWQHLHTKGHTAKALAARIKTMVANGYVVPLMYNYYGAGVHEPTGNTAKQFGVAKLVTAG